MAMIVAVAAGVPCVILLMLAGVRHFRSLPLTQTLAVARSGDQRGIALQTIIIIVVLLAIAGAVAGVLLTRGADTAAQLESADVTGKVDTEAECKAVTIGNLVGAHTDTACTWTGEALTRTNCRLVGGVFTKDTGSAANHTCVVTY